MKTSQRESLHRKWSQAVTDGMERAASRAMLHAVGFAAGDFRKSQVGIASTWSQVTPCNVHIDRLARRAAEGVAAAGGKPVIFNTITISDGISMGTPGMRYSLVSREIIADSIEAVVACEGFDGLVAIGGCDKNMPGCLIAMARLNRPAVFVYGGTIKPGCYHGKPVDVVSVFEAVGKKARGEITGKELAQIEGCAIPGAGSCGGMYTANTMASAIEALGLSLPNSGAQNAVSAAKTRDCRAAGAAVMNLIRRGIRPSDILTREAFLNAIALVMAMGGSTNAVLHLLAIAHAANVKLELDDFTRVGARTPVLADLKPSGKHVMSDLVAIGGTAPLMKMLIEEGLMDGDLLTVTGRTLRQNLQNVRPYPKGQTIIRPLSDPIKPTGHLVILRGNLAP
ncbi:MAG TPA: dihydroxy-acid dehydratase, partial [Kiritimatiellia bacterium]|nr:dihydroxy-acid dehydratase [Kiritimatiellia bacterium]